MKYKLSEIGEGGAKPYPFIYGVRHNASGENIRSIYNFETESGLQYWIEFRGNFKLGIIVTFGATGHNLWDLTGEQNTVRVLNTVITAAKDLTKKYPRIKIFTFSGTHKRGKEDPYGPNARDRIYTYFVRKQFPSWKVSKQGEYIVVTAPDASKQKLKFNPVTRTAVPVNEIGDGSRGTYPIRWGSDYADGPPWEYYSEFQFTAHGHKYMVAIHSVKYFGEDCVEVEFRRENGGFNDITDAGDPLKIINTVVSCIKLFLKKYYAIRAVGFSIMYGKSGTTRSEIYRRFLKKQFPGWRERKTGPTVWFLNPRVPS